MPTDLAATYNASAICRRFPASALWTVTEKKRPVAYGVWVMGNDYSTRCRCKVQEGVEHAPGARCGLCGKPFAALYGAYPPGYLPRVMAMFPGIEPARTLHVFSGSLPAGPYLRCDSVRPADLQCEATDLPARFAADGLPKARLVLADPPYSAEDAAKYGTPMINRRRVLSALAQVTVPGGHLCWLDTQWPMHRKDEWVTAGRILIQRGTQHRARVLTIFERLP